MGEAPNAFAFNLSWLQTQMGLTNLVSSLLGGSKSKRLVAQAIKTPAPEVLPVVRSETDAAESGISSVSTWAVGATPAQTARQVVLEAVLMGLTGSLLGLLIGAAAALVPARGISRGPVSVVLRTEWPYAHL